MQGTSRAVPGRRQVRRVLGLALVLAAVLAARVLVGSAAVFMAAVFLGWCCFPVGFLAAGAAMPYTSQMGPRDLGTIATSILYGTWTMLVGMSAYLLDPAAGSWIQPYGIRIVIVFTAVGLWGVVVWALHRAARHGWWPQRAPRSDPAPGAAEPRVSRLASRRAAVPAAPG